MPPCRDGGRSLTALTQTDRMRLGKLLALLASGHAGERDAAGLAAHRLVWRAGLTWAEVLCPSAGAEPRGADLDDWRAVVAACLQRHDELTDFDRRFLRSIARFPRLSEKQAAVLHRIAERLVVREAAWA